MERSDRIQHLLDSAYRDFHKEHRRNRDPVRFVHAYPRPADQEIVAFLAAILAYGNVATILSSVERVLYPLGDAPHARLLGKDVPAYPTFRHRFTTGEDIEIVLHWLARALQTHGSLENFFLEGAGDNASMRELLSSFVNRLTSQPLPGRLKQLLGPRSRNLKYLISDPNRGSACKRLNMFLRWVVRDADGIDVGLWKRVGKHRLMLPVDTHLLKTLRQLRWVSSKQATWRVVEAATDRLRCYSPEDPIRYDFSLCHLSMAGGRLLHYERQKRA